MTTNYKSYRIINGKGKWIIIDENEKIVNRDPTKEELKLVAQKPHRIKRYLYTDEELLDYLNKFYEDNGKIPVQNDFKGNKNYPGFLVYIRRFGSWNNALKMVGFDINCHTNTTNDELLGSLKRFYEENVRPPTYNDFSNNPKYPSIRPYITRFGSWTNALKLVGLDVDTIIKKGIVQTKYHKERFFELCIKYHFEKESVDLSGNNRLSSFDGICSNGKTYDAKSCGLINGRYFLYHFKNKEKEEIEYYYLGAFNKDYTELMYVWRVPGEIIEKDMLYIGLNRNYEYNVENMNEYNITDRLWRNLHMNR